MVAEADEFAVDASVTPGRVLLCQSDDELADLGGGWGTSGASVRLGPVAGDAPTVPSKQGLGSYDPAVTVRAGERGGNRAEQAAVAVAFAMAVCCGSGSRPRWAMTLPPATRILVCS